MFYCSAIKKHLTLKPCFLLFHISFLNCKFKKSETWDSISRLNYSVFSLIWYNWRVSLFLFQNVGKALRITWKCFMLGLYNFALGYAAPVTVTAAFGPDSNLGRNRTWAERRGFFPDCFEILLHKCTIILQKLTKDSALSMFFSFNRHKLTLSQCTGQKKIVYI